MLILLMLQIEEDINKEPIDHYINGFFALLFTCRSSLIRSIRSISIHHRYGLLSVAALFLTLI